MKRINPRSGRPAFRGTLIAVAAAILVGVPVVAQIQFSDVAANNPRLDDINYVASQEWFIGYRDGTYKPNQNISPSEMTRVLWRVFDKGLTRAEFASFLTAGREGIKIIHQQGALRYREFYDSPGFKDFPRRGTTTYIIGYHPTQAVWEDDGTWYVDPGRYRIRAGCRWMRLGYIPDGGQYFDTIAATDAPLAGYYQYERTTEAHVIELEHTDFAFMVSCP